LAVGGAPNTPPNGPPPSAIQTAPNLVAFDPKQVVPSQQIYLQRNDLIAFNILTNGTSIALRIDYRWLTPQGEIKEGELNLPFVSGSAFVSLPIYEGWLLSFAARVTSGAVLGQWTFLQALITRTPNPNAQSPMHALFWSGFIYAFTANGWPGLPAKELTDGPGIIRSITGSTPAPGAEISEVIPSQRRWTLLCFRSTLTTSATVANRFPGFLLDDGGINLFLIHTNAALVASSALNTQISPGNQFYGDGVGSLSLPFPTPLDLKVGYHIRSNTPGLQAADQWSAPQYLVLEWGQWDS
jgi:hypothetical protein